MTEEQLLSLAEFRESPAFSDLERVVLEYATEMTRTPVEVSEDLFARVRKNFDPAQMIELTAAIAWENYRARFDHALGIESQGFSEGAACALPERASHGA